MHLIKKGEFCDLIHHMLLITQKITNRVIFFITAIWTLSRKSWIALSVDFPCLKPFWASVRILLFVMKAISRLYITFLEFLRRRIGEIWIYNSGYTCILRPLFYVNVWLSQSLFYQEKYPSPLKHYLCQLEVSL